VSHRQSTLLSLLAWCLLSAVSLWAQNAAAVHGIPGYLDPRTGIFHSTPQPHVAADVEAPVTTTKFTGKFVVNFTIKVNSTFSSTDLIGCIVGASVENIGTENPITEVAGSSVARGTGTTVTCSVTIPYSWNLASASTDKVDLNYVILVPGAFVSTPTSAYPTRTADQLIGEIAVPTSGTTTTKTVTPTI
jgi:hypothetical protein